MDVRTTRFGVVEVAEDREITFEHGLLGFPEHRRFCLLQPGDDACFFWLQSTEDPALAFVVTDPSLFVPEYTVPVRPEQMHALGIEREQDAQVFVIVNKVGDDLTGNLQGPLIVNTLSKSGQQLVLADKRWTTRQALVQIGVKDAAASGAEQRSAASA